MKRAILTPLNKSLNEINNVAPDMLCGENVKTYQAQDSVQDDVQAGLFPLEYLNTLEPSRMPPGQPIMLLRNMIT
ncbi:hypothetical protein BGZ76_001929, partial [Entomortierella beljakovae]